MSSTAAVSTPTAPEAGLTSTSPEAVSTPTEPEAEDGSGVAEVTEEIVNPEENKSESVTDEDKVKNDENPEPGPSGCNSKSGEEEEKENAAAAFECNICLDVAKDAVISMCGHLFCWPCLHTWLETRPHRQICPVCKAGIGRDKVVPIYGRGDSNPTDPREKPLPPRPRGPRPEPETTGGAAGAFSGLGGMGGGAFQMSFGIGAFPFGFFTTNFNMGDQFHGGIGARAHGPPEGSAQYEEEQFLHKAFLWVAFAFIFWLLIA